MKTPVIIFFAIFTLFAVLNQSCEKETYPVKSSVTFAVGSGEGQLKSSLDVNADSADIPASWHIIISVEDKNGMPLLKEEWIRLLAFGDGFISEKIEMNTGEYFLTQFLVVNSEGKVIYASPREGSSKAGLVNNPLPLMFRVTPQSINRVTPEVLAVEDSNPGEFGYIEFSFDVVKTILFYAMAVDDNPLYGRPSVIIPAHMIIITPAGDHLEYDLRAGVNKILVKEGFNSYHIIVENPQYPSLELEVSPEKLKNTSPENPMIFNLSNPGTNILRIKPGPENGTDAMITDLNPSENFGDYPFFEASYITEPVLTVMRTKWSLTRFDLSDLPESARIRKVILTLYFDQPLWDSLYQSELDDFMLWNDTLVFRQIIEPWEEDQVSWEKMPETIKPNQVPVPLDSFLDSNVRTYDVTSLFVPLQEIAAPNYGFMFRHPDLNAAFPGGLKFASSDHPEEYMRPELVVRYEMTE